MVTSLIISLSYGTRGSSFCQRTKGWGKETGRRVSISALGGQHKGAEVSPRLCCCLGAILWSCCLAHPGTGLAPLWDRAHWLLLSFRVAFIETQGFLLRLLPRKWCGSPSFIGPGQGSSLTLTSGLGLSSSARAWGGVGQFLPFADNWLDSSAKDNVSTLSWPPTEYYYSRGCVMKAPDRTLERSNEEQFKNTLFLSTSYKRS